MVNRCIWKCTYDVDLKYRCTHQTAFPLIVGTERSGPKALALAAIPLRQLLLHCCMRFLHVCVVRSALVFWFVEVRTVQVLAIIKLSSFRRTVCMPHLPVCLQRWRYTLVGFEFFTVLVNARGKAPIG